MHSKLAFALLIVLVALFGCEKTLDIPGPLYQKKVVLNGLLQPDSTIAIRLAYTAPTNTSIAYEQITNAQVTVTDNGQPATILLHKGGGVYRGAGNPKPGHIYHVTAIVPGYGTVEAEDQMPYKPASTFQVDSLVTGNINDNPNFNVTWQPINAVAVQWLAFYVGSPDFDISLCPTNSPNCILTEIVTFSQNYIVTNSGYLDRFNSTYESYLGSYNFYGPVRFDPDKVLGKPVDLTFTVANQTVKRVNQRKGTGNIIDLFTASANYDKFLRSVLLARLNRIRSSDDVFRNPFAEVTPVYTNVINGLGIFGAINLQRYTY